MAPSSATGGINPSEKMSPSFRQEDQHMAENLKPVVIGPPAYSSPDPATAGGRLVPVEEHPLSGDLSSDYGKDAAAASAAAVAQEAAGDDEGYSSEDRDEWKKADWQKRAEELGLPTSGTVAELRESVEEAEENDDNN